jgi:hypothetical protein
MTTVHCQQYNCIYNKGVAECHKEHILIEEISTASTNPRCLSWVYEGSKEYALMKAREEKEDESTPPR